MVSKLSTINPFVSSGELILMRRPEPDSSRSSHTWFCSCITTSQVAPKVLSNPNQLSFLSGSAILFSPPAQSILLSNTSIHPPLLHHWPPPGPLPSPSLDPCCQLPSGSLAPILTPDRLLFPRSQRLLILQFLSAHGALIISLASCQPSYSNP